MTEKNKTKADLAKNEETTALRDEQKENLINNAERALKFGQTQNARKLFLSASKNYPDDWRGWWGIIRTIPIEEYAVDFALCQNIDECRKFLDERVRPSWIKEYNKALDLAPNLKKQLIVKFRENKAAEFKRLVLDRLIDLTESKIDDIENKRDRLKDDIHFARQKEKIGVMVMNLGIFGFMFFLKLHWVFLVAFALVAVFGCLIALFSTPLKNDLDEYKYYSKTLQKHIKNQKKWSEEYSIVDRIVRINENNEKEERA